jgi:hypothetical protein
MIETKGCRTDEEIDWLLSVTDTKDCIYVTIDAKDNSGLDLIAPASPRIEQRLNTVKRCYDSGRMVIIAINPFMPEINDYENIISLMKQFPKAGLWLCELHLQRHQKIKGFKEWSDIDFAGVVAYANDHGIHLENDQKTVDHIPFYGVHDMCLELWPHAKKVICQDVIDALMMNDGYLTFDKLLDYCKQKDILPDCNVSISEIYSRKAGKYFRHQITNTIKSDEISYIEYMRIAWENNELFPWLFSCEDTILLKGGGIDTALQFKPEGIRS